MTTVQGGIVPDWIFGEGRNFLIAFGDGCTMCCLQHLAVVGLRVVLNEWLWQTKYMWSDVC